MFNIEKLYKFRSVDKNSLNSLANNKLWLSNLADFNDPFESTYIFDDVLPDSIIDYVSNQVRWKNKHDVGERKYNEMLSSLGVEGRPFTEIELFTAIAKHDLDCLIQVIHNSKILSLSGADADTDPVTENLMWSHYADGLRGFCLVFDRKAFMVDTGSPMRWTRVKYQNNPNTIKVFDFMQSESILKNQNDNYVQNVFETITTKSISWEYENEVRAIDLSSDNYYQYSESSLLELIIGEKMPEGLQKILVNTAKIANPTIKISKACLKSGSYKIEIIDKV